MWLTLDCMEFLIQHAISAKANSKEKHFPRLFPVYASALQVHFVIVVMCVRTKGRTGRFANGSWDALTQYKKNQHHIAVRAGIYGTREHPRAA